MMGSKDHLHAYVKNMDAQGKARGEAPTALSGKEPPLWGGH